MNDLVLEVWWHGTLYEHAVWKSGQVKELNGLVARCGIAHSPELDEKHLGYPDVPLNDYLDCPVASRWTLVRAK